MIATIWTTGCAVDGERLSDEFVIDAGSEGYLCVETVVPEPAMIALRNCRADSGQKLAFSVFGSAEDRRRWGDLATTGSDTTIVNGDVWVLSGDDAKVVERLAGHLRGLGG